MSEKKQCLATTVSGERCKLKAGPTGYCHLHDPEKAERRRIAEREHLEYQREQLKKGEKLREILQVVGSVCRQRGWNYNETHVDRETWRYATISVGREIFSGLSFLSAHETYDIAIEEDQVSITPQSSFPDPGTQELFHNILAEVKNIPWVKLPQTTKREPVPVSIARQPNAMQQLKHLIKRFHSVAQKLQLRHENRETLRINDEYDVQNLLYALLAIFFDDVRPEEYTPSYAGASSRMDFILKNEKIVIEVKMTRPKLRDKEIGDQLIIDIERYRSHPDCQTLVCFVYDPGNYVQNPVGLENDLSGTRDKIKTNVFVVPRS